MFAKAWPVYQRNLSNFWSLCVSLNLETFLFFMESWKKKQFKKTNNIDKIRADRPTDTLRGTFT